jgi:hypothetical protein
LWLPSVFLPFLAVFVAMMVPIESHRVSSAVEGQRIWVTLYDNLPSDIQVAAWSFVFLRLRRITSWMVDGGGQSIGQGTKILVYI